MIQGTSSSAGKSLLTAALCRIYARRGVRVAPFKAQNMSNNAAVCPDGSEIGRAQAVQAAACGLEPTADMNPILIKPEADARSQVVVMGRAWRVLAAREYYAHRDELWALVTQALDRLLQDYELVVIEGAGSPVELNLRAGDMVNMAVACHARSPVLLVGDIDRGGIFAQLLGTLWLLPDDERALVKGLLVNKFRGDATLFADGVRILEERGGVPVVGVIPYLRGLAIPEEDAVALEEPGGRGAASVGAVTATQAGPRERGAVPSAPTIDIAVIHFPRIANFDDFDPLAAEPGVQLRYVSSPAELGQPQAIILPGTKSTTGDLQWLRGTGLAPAIQERAAAGTAVVGICGGYQMLGRTIRDPQRVESSKEVVPGLGLLPVETLFLAEKATYRIRARVRGGPGWLARVAGQVVSGYEIHMGRTNGADPWLTITARSQRPVEVADGAASEDGRVWGCYLHGLFETQAFRRAWLAGLGWENPGLPSTSSTDLARRLDDLAEAVEQALNMELLEEIVWGS